MKKKRNTSWQGIVMSTTQAPLLGGNKVHTSLRYAAKSDAEKWVEAVVDGNERAVRPCIGRLIEIEATPHFNHCDRCGSAWYVLHKCEKGE